MSIQVKKISSAEDLRAVFQLRHRVFVGDCRRFAARKEDTMLVDLFDAVPEVTILAVFAGTQLVGTMRVNANTEIGLPADEYIDLSATREKLAKHGGVIVGGSMLAVENSWRHKGRVVLSLFSAASSVMAELQADYILAAVSAETISLYSRMGFESAGKAEWHRPIGGYLVPIVAPYAAAKKWCSSLNGAVVRTRTECQLR